MNTQTCKAFMLLLFVLLVAYLYLFGLPTMMNIAKIALVAVAVYILAAYWVVPTDDRSSLSVYAYKDLVLRKLRECVHLTNTTPQFKTCVQTTTTE